MGIKTNTRISYTIKNETKNLLSTRRAKKWLDLLYIFGELCVTRIELLDRVAQSNELCVQCEVGVRALDNAKRQIEDGV